MGIDERRIGKCGYVQGELLHVMLLRKSHSARNFHGYLSGQMTRARLTSKRLSGQLHEAGKGHLDRQKAASRATLEEPIS